MDQPATAVPQNRIVTALTRVSGAFAGIMTLALTLLIVADVASRNFTNRPVSGALELTQYVLMPLIVFCALAYAEAAGEHIQATVLVERLSPRVASAVDLITRLVMIVVVVVLTAAAIDSAIFATEIRLESTGAITLPLWPIKILAAVGLALFALQLIASTVSRLFRRSRSDSHV